MSGETAKDESGWTIDTAHRHLQDKIADLEKLMNQRFSDNDKAVESALKAVKEDSERIATAMEKRFGSVNEFRAQLSDQASIFMPRAEAESRMAAVTEKVTELTNRMNTTTGQSEGSKVTVGRFYGAIAAVVGVLTIIVLLANGVFTK